MALVNKDMPKSAATVKVECGGNASSYAVSQPSTSNSSERQSIFAPSWLVRSTSTLSDANMEWSLLNVATHFNFKLQDSTSKVATVQIPIMRNKVALKVGDELLIYAGDHDSEHNSESAASGNRAAKSKAKAIGKQASKAPPTKRARAK